MHSIQGQLVCITGASSGIGASCARAFASHGARLLLVARRIERLEALARELRADYQAEVRTHLLDVRDRDAVDALFASMPADWSAIDILVNNAGLSRGLSKLHEGEHDDWDEMIDTNVKGLLHVTRAVVPGMVQRNRGHIINIGSIAGQEVYPNGNVYCASKHAVDAITKGLRMDLVETAIRVTTIDPGLVETEFSIVRFHGDEARAKTVYNGLVPLTPDDVADAVVYAATRPPSVCINQIVLTPTAQASALVVHRAK